MNYINNFKMSLQTNRKCITCIMGHVDTGKTRFISNLSSHSKDHKRTKLNDTEAGGITQQVGTTIFENEHLKQFIPENLQSKFNMDFVTIDTPGHESFHNIRKIGINVAHLVLVFADITKDMDTDTLDYLETALETESDYSKTILVLNKMDLIYGAENIGYSNLKRFLNKQSKDYNQLLEDNYSKIATQLSYRGIYAEPYYNKKTKLCLPMIPISAETGDGIPDLLLYMSNMYIDKQSLVSESPIGYILDKRTDPHMGKILLGIMKYGSLNQSNTIKIANSYFPIQNLMQPVPSKDSRENKWIKTDSVNTATSFVFKVDPEYYDLIELGSEFEPSDNDELIIDENFQTKTKYLSSNGVYVIIPSESMLDGVIKHFNSEHIPIFSYTIGTFGPKDLIIYSNRMLGTDEETKRNRCIMICMPELDSEIDETKIIKKYFGSMYDQILNSNIKIILGGTIYNLATKYNQHLKSSRERLIAKYKAFSYFEADTITKYVFRTHGPIICGVKVNQGVITIGSAVYDTESNYYGIVNSIKLDSTDLNYATQGMEVCIGINNDNDTASVSKTNTISFKNKSDCGSDISYQVAKDIQIEIPKNIPKAELISESSKSDKTSKSKSDKSKSKAKR